MTQQIRKDIFDKVEEIQKVIAAIANTNSTKLKMVHLSDLEHLIFVEVATVRDGTIAKGDMVWWRANLGPEYVKSDSGSHWDNIKNYPGVYSIVRPVIQYLD